MALDESQRHQLHQRLDGALGSEAAVLLMSQLPPVSWDDLATKQDVAVLSAEIRAELHKELGSLRGEMLRMGQNLFFGMAGLVVASVSLAFAAARFGT